MDHKRFKSRYLVALSKSKDHPIPHRPKRAIARAGLRAIGAIFETSSSLVCRFLGFERIFEKDAYRLTVTRSGNPVEIGRTDRLWDYPILPPTQNALTRSAGEARRGANFETADPDPLVFWPLTERGKRNDRCRMAAMGRV